MSDMSRQATLRMIKKAMRFRPEQVAYIERLAKRESRSFSAMVRVMVNFYMLTRKK